MAEILKDMLCGFGVLYLLLRLGSPVLLLVKEYRRRRSQRVERIQPD
jgi:MFS-type transporter involved in bile tolerance (Atg22 family)